MAVQLKSVSRRRIFPFCTYHKFLLLFLFITFIGYAPAVMGQTASFTASSTSTCTPSNIYFNDTSTGETSRLWNFGNSNLSLDQNPSANYPQPGVYTVTLTINGGASSTSQTINVYPKPNPTIPLSVEGCEPFSTSLTAVATPVVVSSFVLTGTDPRIPLTTTVGGLTGGNAVSYTWNFFGDLPTVTKVVGVDANPNVLSLTNIPVGIYDVLLTVTDDKGCSNSVFKQSVIIVNPKPTADFSFVKANLCGTGDVNFTGIASVATGTIAGYTWNFGDPSNVANNTSGLQNPIHNYSTAGSYVASFTATSAAGCSSNKIQKTILFNSSNSVDFSTAGSCVGQPVTFTDLSSSGVVSWAWDFDNNGSVDATTQNPVYTYNTTGAVVAKLTVTFNDGCVMTTTHPLTITGPTSAFTYITNAACPPDYSIGFTSTATASAGNTITGWAWDFDNNGTTDDQTATPTHNFNGSGSFPVRLTVTSSDGCSNSILKNVVIPDAVVDFSATPVTGCAPLSSLFTSIYSNAADPIQSYSWDFGDVASGGNNTSTLPTPSHNYTAAGKYNVTLIVTTTKGCTLTQTKTEYIIVGTPQNITLITTSQASYCHTNTVEFTATISALTDQLVWDFNDGTPAVSQDVSGETTSSTTHIYGTPGTKSATLTAWYNGCPSTPYTLNGIIINEPTASFTPSATVQCAVPSTIIFTNSSTGATNQSWDFGDPTSGVNNSSTAVSPSHTYTATGDYLVKLTVTNSTTGCSDVTTRTIHITTSNPLFTVNNTVVCAGTASTFTNQVTENSSSNFSVGSFLWTFGDGQTSTLPNPSHTYTTPGLYTVSLEVKETRGCIYSYSLPTQIDVRGPIIDFTVNKSQVCITQSDPVTFTSTVTKAANDPAVSYKYYWTFGDGGNSTDQNPVHTYIATGSYTVTLQVTNNLGCVSTISHLGTVSAPTFAAGFATTRDIYCKNDLVNFNNTAAGTITSYDWDLNGDGIFEILGGAASQSRTFTTTGTFTIRQRVTSSLNCTDIFTKTIDVVDGTGGIILNNPELGCAPVAAVFDAADPAEVVSTYLWNFGDGQTSASRNPNHYYTVPGHYTVTLTEVLTGGCTKSTTMPIVIAGAVGTFTYDNTPDCVQHTEHYFANNLEGVTSLTWDFGDGVTQTQAISGGETSATTAHTYTTWGTRLPILILRDPTCGDYSYYNGVDQRINTSEAPVAAFTSAAVGGLTCEKLIFQFTDQSTIVDPRYAVSTWDWDFGDSSPHSNLQNPKHAYAIAGTYHVTLSITNGFLPSLCPASITHDVKANPLPLATVTNQSQVFCSGNTSSNMVLGTSNSLTGTTFAWTRTTPTGISSALATTGSGLAIGDAISGGTFINTTAAPIVVTYTITPTGPSPTFCTGDPIKANITVDPTPTISSASAKTICNNSPVGYNIISPTTGTTFSWTASVLTDPIGGTITGWSDCSSTCGTSIGQTLVNTGTSPGIVRYIITPTGPATTTCPGIPFNLDVTVEPTPIVMASLTKTICSNNSVAINLSTTVSGTTFYYAAPTISNASGNITGGVARATPGTTAAITDVLVNTTATVQTATYIVYPIINGCIGTPVTIVVTVNPVPIVTTGLAQGICTNASYQSTSNLALTTTPSMSGALFTYAAPSNTGGMTGGTARITGSADPITDTFINTTNTAQTATYSVIATAPAGLGGCVGQAKNVVITVYPRALITSALTGSVCSGSVYSYTISSNVANSSLTWTRAAVPGITPATGGGSTSSISETLTNSLGTPIDVSYILTPTGPAPGNCLGTPSTLVVTVNPTPTVAAGLAQTICSGAAANLALSTSPDVSGTTFYWSAPSISGGAGNITGGTARVTPGSASPITDVLVNTTSSSRTATYAVRPRSPLGCIGSARNVVITVSPKPAINPLTSTTCSGTTFSVTPLDITNGIVPAGTTYSWSAPSGSGFTGGAASIGSPTSISGTLVNTTNTAATAIYTVTPTSGSCQGSSFTVTVTVQPVANVIATLPSQVICHNTPTNIALSTTTTGTVTYSWTATLTSGTANGFSNNSGSTIAQTLTNTTTSPATVTYHITPYIGGCAGTAIDVAIIVNPAGQVNQPASQVVCNNAATTAINFTTSNLVGTTTYSWTNNTTSIGLGASGSGDIGSFTGINNGTTPVVATIVVTPHFGNGGAVCAGSAKTFTITVNPTGEVNQPANVVFCNNATGTVSFASSNTGGTTTYTWTNDNTAIGLLANGSNDISFTATNTTTAPIQANIVVTPTFSNGGTSCVGPTKTFTITVNPSGQANNPGNQVLCNNTVTSLITFSTNNTIGTTSYSWVNNTPDIGLAAFGSGPTIPAFTAINTGTTPVVATITLTPTFTNGTVSCQGPAQNFTITVNPTPTLTSASSLSICSGLAVNYTPTSAVKGTTFTWTAQNTIGTVIGYAVSGSDAINNTLTNTGSGDGQVTYTITPHGPSPTNCTGPAFELKVNVLNCAPKIGVAKQLVSLDNNGDGTFDALFNIRVQNYGNLPLDNIQVTDTLNQGALTGKYAVLGISSANFAVNSAYNGNSDWNLLVSTGNSLAAGASSDIRLRIKILSAGTYSNQATASSTTSETAKDRSVNGSDPDPNHNGDPVESSPTPVITACSPAVTISIANAQICYPFEPYYELNPTVTGTPASYLWTTDGTGTFGSNTASTTTYTPSASDVQDGQVVLTLTAVSGGVCPNVTSSMILTIWKTPATPTATITQPTCSTSTGTIEVTSPLGLYEYKIDAGGTYQASTTFTGVASGTRTIYVRNINNTSCTSSASVTVSSTPILPANATASTTIQPSCSAPTGTIVVTAPTGGYEYNIDGGAYQTSTTFAGILPGSHSILVRSKTDNSCISAAATSVTVTADPSVPAAATASTTIQPTCSVATGTIVVTAPTGGTYEYNIDGGTWQSSTIFANVAAGAHNILVRRTTDPTCISSATIVNVNAQPTAPEAPTATTTIQPTCSVATGTIVVTAPLGLYEYNIDGGTWQTSNTFTNVAAGPHPILVRRSNSITCISAPTSVTINTQPTVPANATASTTIQPSCSAPTGTIVVTAPTGGYEYNIDGGAYQTSTTFAGILPGSHSILVRSKTDNSCISAAATSVTVTADPFVPAAATASTTIQPTCSVATGTIVVTAPTGGTYEYNIDGGTWQSSTIFANVAAGAHNILVRRTTDPTCISSATIVNVNTQPTAPEAPTATTTIQPTCSVVTGTIVVTAPLGLYEYNIDGGTWQTSTTFTNVAAGPHPILVRRSNSITCISAPTSVTVNALPTALTATITNSTNVLCYGAATGTATVTATAGTGTAPYTYLWSNGSTDQTATGLIAGTYTVTVTDKNGCTVLVNGANAAVITQPAGAITSSAGADATICSTGTHLLAGTASNYSSLHWTTSGTGSFGGNETTLTPVYTPSVADIATGQVQLTLTATGNAGCTPVSDYMVLNLSPNPAANAGADATICSGGTFAITGATATNFASLTWSTSGSGTFSNVNALNPVYTPSLTDISNGSVTLTLAANKLGTSCSNATDAMLLTITAAPTLTPVVNTNTTCGNAAGSVTLTSSVAGIVTINGVSEPSSPTATFTGLTAGYYTAMFTAATSGCMATANFQITNSDSDLRGSVVVTNASCNGGTGSATATISGGTAIFQYALDNAAYGSATPSTTATYSDLAVGNHTVKVKDASGCIYTIDFTITQPAALSAVLVSQTNVLCFGDATGSVVMSATGGTSPYTFTSTGGTVSGNTISALAASVTPYTITVTDAKHCTATMPVTITGPASTLAATITASTNVLCYGAATGTATVMATAGTGTAPYTYLWSNGSTDQTATGLIAGTYTVTVTDKNGCTVLVNGANAAVITQPAGAITAGAGADATICSTGTHLLAGTASNYSSLLWTTSGTGSFGGNETTLTPVYTPSVADIATGQVQLTLTATGNAGCTPVSDYMVLTIWPAPTADAGPSTAAICAGTTYPLTGATATDYAGLIWSSNAGGSFDNPNALNPRFTPTAGYSGTVRLTLTATGFGSGACSNTSDYIDLFVNAAPTLTVGTITNTTCNNSSGSVVFTSSEPGTVTLNGASHTTPYTFTGLAAGYFTATFVANSTGCIATANFQINNTNSDLTGTAVVTDAVCNGANGSAIVTAFGGTANYQFNIDNGGYGMATSSPVNFAGLAVGSHNVKIKDANGCTYTVAFDIDQPTPLVLSLASQTNVSCKGLSDGSVTVQATGGTTPYIYSITFGTAVISGNMVTAMKAGNYTIGVEDANHCFQTLNVTITETTCKPNTVNDNPITSEDTPATGSVLSNDSDPNSPALTLSLTQFVINGITYAAGTTATISGVGTLVMNNNGTYTFTPVANYSGPVPPVTYTATNGTNTSTAELTITVNPVNDAPIAGVSSMTSQFNPGGTNSLTISAIQFSGTDVDGTITSIVIPSMPINATSITIGGTTYTSLTFPAGGITIPTNTTGQPLLPISIDPFDGAVTSVLSYNVIDNNGLTSLTTGSLSIPFAGLSVSGTVFNDTNGLTNNTVDGTGTTAGGALYMILVNTLNQVVASIPVTANGTYQFTEADGLAANTFYNLILSNGAQTPGATLSAATYPAGWVSTGENIGTGSGSDGTINGMLEVNTNSGNLANANFGVEQLPTATTSVVASQPNPGNSNLLIVNPTAFTGTDPDGGTIASIHFTGFPTGATSVTIGGTNYTLTTWPSGGLTVPAGTTVSVDPTDGTGSIDLPFRVIDNAGKESTNTATITLPIADLTITGTVFHDNNGGVINGTGTGTAGTSQLYANLVSTATGKIVGVISVNSDGTYSLGTPQGVKNGTNYTVVLSTTQGLTGGVASALLPSGWVNTADGLIASGDGLADGIIAVSVTTSSVINANFGIELLPVATSGVNTQQNPGGTNLLTIDAVLFAGTDADGTIAQIRYTTFPTGITTITIGGTSYSASTWPAPGVTVATGTTVSVDPIDGTGDVVIPFKVIDNAGKESSNEANLTLSLTELSISGTVYDDGNGLLGLPVNTVDGMPTNVGGTIYANLITSSDNKVAASVSVATDGTYLFTTAKGVTRSEVYNLILTNSAQVVGSILTMANYPTGWISTGENLGAGAGSDEAVNGILAVPAVTGNVVNANFGIDQLPVTSAITVTTQQNPGGTNLLFINPASFTGTDADGTIAQIHYTTFPTGVNTITIGGTSYASAGWPLGGVTLNSGTAVSVDPLDGTGNVVIAFKVIDNAGKESTNTATLTLPLSDLIVSGTVYDDANGLLGLPANTVDGTVTNAGGAVYANIVDGTNLVVKSVAVAADGTYSFTTSDGVKTATPYTIILTSTIQTKGATLTTASYPLNWVSTGENIGASAGSDASADGKLAVTTTSGSVANANFGIDQLPTANGATAATQPNPGGTTNLSVGTTLFTGTDPAPGNISFIKITSFPTFVTSITIGGTTYTSGNFPGTGVTIAANTDGNPTSAIAIDPNDGSVSPVILFKVIDNAGKESSNTASVIMPFGTLTLTGNVFNDVNGLSNGIVDGAGTNAGTLYMNLINGLNQVVASKPVAAGGTYSFSETDGLTVSTNYKLILTNGLQSDGTTLSAATYPAGWVSTGENIGSGIGNDGLVDGILVINIGSASVTNANFGVKSAMTASAGLDDSMCSSSVTYTIIGALATNYSSLLWSTNGTGLFSDASIQNPNYKPSEADIATGEVQLTLTAFGVGSVGTISDQMTLVIWKAATAFAGPDASICEGKSFVLTGATASNYTTISWTSSGGTFDNPHALNPTFTPTTTGPITISLTANGSGSGTCPNAVSSMTLTVTNSIVLSTPVVTHANCQGGLTGSVQLGVNSGGAGPFSYSLSIGTTNSTGLFTGLSSGGYTYTVTDANGCTASGSFQVTDPNLLTLAITTEVDATCNGFSNGSASVTASGGTAPYTFAWTGTATQADKHVNPNSVTGLSASTYLITVTDAKGCNAIQTIRINQPSTLNVVLVSQINVTCKGGSNGTIVVDATGGVAPYKFSSPAGIVSGNTISGLVASPTPYIITVTDANLCTATMNVTITEPANALSASITSSTNVLCYGSASGSATVTANNGTPPYTYLWSNGSTDQTAANLIAGTYSVTVTDKNGCFVNLINAVTITQPAGNITVYAGPDQTICSTTVVTLLTGTSAANAISYKWTTSGTGIFTNQTSLYNATYTPSAADIATGQVQLTLTAKGNGPCAVVSDFMVLNIWPPPTADAGPSSAAICAGSTYVLTGATAANYSTLTWSSNAGGSFNNPNALNPTFTPASGFNGIVRLTLSAGRLGSSCSNATSYIDLTVNAVPTLTVSSIINTTCNNSLGSVVLTGSVAGSISLNGVSKPSPATFTGLSAGYFTATFTAVATGCTTTTNFQITNSNSDLSGTVIVTDASCNTTTGSVTVNATGGTTTGGSITSTDGYRFRLDGGVSQSGNSFTGISSGNHTVKITDDNGCTYSIDFYVNKPTLLILELASKTNVLCYGSATGSVIVNAAGGTTAYNYSVLSGPSTPEVTGNIITGMLAGTYLIKVEDAHHCTATLPVVISQPSNSLSISETPAIVTNPACNGTSTGSINTTVTGGTPPYSYSWSNGSNSADPALLAAGSYSVTVTDSNGCSVSGGPYVLVNPTAVLLTASSIIGTTCGASTGSVVLTSSDGSMVTLNGVTKPSGAVFTGLIAGYYTPVSLGTCPATTTFRIDNTTSTLFANIASLTSPSCHNGKGSVVVNGIGGNGKLTYSLDGTTPQSTGSFLNISAGNHTIMVVDANSCIYTVSFNIFNPPLLSLALTSQNNVLCSGSSTGNVIVAASGGTPDYTYSIASQPITGTSAIVTGNMISNMKAGNYTIRVTDTNGCTAELPVIISQPAPVAVSAGPDASICESDTYSLSGGSATNALSVYWISNGTGYFNNANTLNPVYTPGADDIANGLVTLTLNALQGASCPPVTDAMVLKITHKAAPNAGADATINEDSDFPVSNATVKYATSVLWTTNGAGTLINASTLTPIYKPALHETGIVTLTLSASSANPCGMVTDELILTIKHVNHPPVAVTDNFTGKENQKLEGSLLPNDYDIDSDHLLLNIKPIQDVAHGTLTLLTNGDFTYTPDIDFIGNDTFIYQICDNGIPSLCDTTIVKIAIGKDEACEVYVPNSFSPNGDGVHDVFKIRCIYNYENPIFEVFNRWGNLVYKKEHYGDVDFWGGESNAWWDGHSDNKLTIGSQELPVGTYYYVLKLNKTKALTGFLYLNK